MSICNELDIPCVTTNIENYCAQVGAAGGSVCKATIIGDASFEEPLSSMLELISNNMYCGVPLTQDQIDNAYDAFVKVTGLEEQDFNKILKTIQDEFESLFRFNAAYMFLPITILISIIIWIMVIVGWITWPVGMYVTTLVWIVLYGASIAYRIHLTTVLRNRFNKLIADSQRAQETFKHSIAYTSQGLLAAAAAITTPAGETPWTCNALPF